MVELSRRRFGLGALATLSGGCVSNASRSKTESGGDRVTDQTTVNRSTERSGVNRESSTRVTSESTDLATQTPQSSGTGSTNGTADAQIEMDEETETRSTEPQTLYERFRLEENEYENFHLSFDASMELRLDFVVRRGPPVDVVLFDPEEYRAFRQQYRARYNSELSVFHATNVPAVSGSVGSGDYVLVVNNTDWSRAVPSPSPPYSTVEDECIVDLEFEAKPPSQD